MRFLAPIIAVLLFGALPATAINDWGYTGCKNANVAGGGDPICFSFDSTLTATWQTFRVQVEYALACLKPSIAASGPANLADATIYFCSWNNPASCTAATAAIQVCPQAGCPLDGTEGAPDTQKSCVALGTGLYGVSFTPPSTGTSLFSVQEQ